MIVDPAEVMMVLGVSPGTRDGAIVSLLHKRVERLVKSYVRHNVEAADHVEFLPAGTVRTHRDRLVDQDDMSGPYLLPIETLQLANVPVRQVYTIHQNLDAWSAPGGVAGNWSDTYLLDPGDVYLVDWDEPGLCRSGHVLRNYSGWPTLPRTVRVSYQAGWTAEELEDEAGDYKLAVLQSAQKFFNEVRSHHAATDTAGTGAIQTETMDGAFFSFGNAADNFGMRLALPESVLKMLEPRVRMSAFM